MNKFWAALGWMWARKLFFGVMLGSAVLFFVLFFPFSDLSDVVTSAVARATGNQVYVQFDSLDMHVVPMPAVSATNVSIETSLPPLKAAWAKVTPSLMSVLFSLPTAIKAATGDAEAARAMSSKIGGTFAAEGLLGGDVELSVGSGSKSDSGKARSRVSLAMENIKLAEVQKWSEVSLKFSGDATAVADVQIDPEMGDQPEGNFQVQIKKFNLPAGTVMVPFGEANLPVNVPNITLANVVLKGRLTNGNLQIDEGTFGQAGDPIYGKIKGTIGMRLQAQGANVFPMFGSYNLTVDLNTTQMVEKDLGFAFMLLNSAKTPVAGGGARYLFRANGNGIGMQYGPPGITRINSF